MIEAEELDLRPLITHRVGLAGLPGAIAQARRGEALKTILVPGRAP